MAFISQPSPDAGCAAESCAVLIIPTHAAQKPEIIYTMILTRSALIPERRADFSLPPTPSTYHPKGIFFKRTTEMIASTAKTYTPAGMFAILLPRTLNPVFPSPSYPAISGKVAPPERKFAKPRQMYIVPRVAINGATFSFVMIRPLTHPITAPTTSIMITIIGTLK